MVAERAQKAIALIDKQIQELNDLYGLAKKHQDFETASQRLARWEGRTIDLLSKEVSPEEGKRLKKLIAGIAEQRAELEWMSIVAPLVLLEGRVNKYTGFLRLLQDELTKHPDIVLPAAIVVGVLPPTSSVKAQPPAASRTTILILAANPKDTQRLRLDQEVREIDNGLQRAQRREEFALKQVWAARPVDVRRAMLDFKPDIVHFCGHGAGEEGIAFEDETGHAKLLNAKTLADFFKLFADQVECVVLNACYSEIQAAAIAQHINHVVGMKREIGDTAAIEFAVAFYDALGAGGSIEFAYELARNATQWAGIPEQSRPILKSRGRPAEPVQQVKEPFTLDKFLARVFDPLFVPSERYAELLADEIPANKRIDALIEIYRKKTEGESKKLVHIVKAVIKKLSDEQLAQFLAVVSDELKTTQDEAVIRFTLQFLPPESWPKISEVARLRIENKLIQLIREGKALDTGKVKGAIGISARDFLKYFTLREQVSQVLLGKLSLWEGYDADDRRYVVNFFWNVLPEVVTNEWEIQRLVRVISSAVRDGDSYVRQLLIGSIRNFPEKWQKKFAAYLIDLTDRSNPAVHLSDGTPFLQGLEELEEKGEEVEPADIPF